MRVTVRFYGHLQGLIAEKSVGEYELDANVTVSKLLEKLLQNDTIRDAIFDKNQALKPEITLLKNGREVKFLDGLETSLEHGDVVSVFPIVAGG